MATYTINSNSITNSSLNTTMGTLSISPLTTATLTHPNTSINWNNLNLSPKYFDTANVKQYEIIETTEDLLALSCAWHRCRAQSISVHDSFSDKSRSPLLRESLFAHVNEDDRQKASAIRDYYLKKFTFMVLKDTKLTNFRNDLKQYITGDAKKFTDKMLPLVYRLPEFYDYDVKFDKMAIGLNKKVARRDKTADVELAPLDSFYKARRGRKVTEYWMVDQDKCAYRLTMDHTNLILGLWTTEFKTKSLLKFRAEIRATSRDEFGFYEISKILPLDV